jgi:MerR family copper efflux transcriptional regulator
MKIGKAAQLSGLTVKTVRYYADIKIVSPAVNSQTGYRDYSDSDVAKLHFVGKARQFNFSTEECRELLSLYEDQARPSREVKKLTLAKIAHIEEKMQELASLKRQLATLADKCSGDDRPNCPIIEELSK